MAYLFDFSPFTDRMTDNAKKSLYNADTIARSFGSQYIGTEHILLGVLHQSGSVGAKLLESIGITYDRAKLALNLTPKSLLTNVQARGLSETAKLTLRMSWEVAQEFNQDYCGTEHILFSLLSQKNSRATTLLKDMNIELTDVRSELENYLNSQQEDFELASEGKAKTKRRKPTALDYFGIDITDKARRKKLDPLIGRQNQLNRIITILARRNKNNPVLIGQPGVGKTAIVEGLAQRIVSDDVPEILHDKRIVTLDLSGMIAGTKYRGEFESRLKKIMKELTQDPDVIVFIDEMHLLVGAGAAEGAIDAGNMLKPALARGQIRVVGATTVDEYRKHIEKDSALERRFQPVMVPEANIEETHAILKGLKKHYEDFHGVKINDEVVSDAVRYADRYVTQRNMPDKAIDLIDEASALVRIERGKIPAEQRKIKRTIKLVEERMEDAVESEDYERAAIYKTRIAKLHDKLDGLKVKSNKSSKLKITSDDLSRVVSTMTGIPTQKVARKEAKYLLDLEKHLSSHVIGQHDAIKHVARAIRRNRSGIADKRRPIGSFIFLGPTGVGKTELAKVIAREVYDSLDSLIKIDMSEFSERHTVARLVGAPAGYVGYDDGGQLTEKILRQPYSLILLDEIEKAHPEVFNMLLQILEDGTLTDSKGRKVDFTNTTIIMTGNVGAKALQKAANIGFQAHGDDAQEQIRQAHSTSINKVHEELKRLMRPELLNRLDKVVVFRPLGQGEVRKILDLQISDLSERLGEQRLGIKVLPSAKKLLMAEGYDPVNGVRPLRRAIQENIEDTIADGVLSGEYQKGDVISVGGKKQKFVFRILSE